AVARLVSIVPVLGQFASPRFVAQLLRRGMWPPCNGCAGDQPAAGRRWRPPLQSRPRRASRKHGRRLTRMQSEVVDGLAAFTPATGVRFLVGRDRDRPAVVRALGTAVQEICARQRFSSAHVNFCLADEVAALAPLGYEERTGFQFQWINPGWRTFDDYLDAF